MRLEMREMMSAKRCESDSMTRSAKRSEVRISLSLTILKKGVVTAKF